MPKRTIKSLFYTEADGNVHSRGAEVELSKEEVERGDVFGAFEESPERDLQGPELAATSELPADFSGTDAPDAPYPSALYDDEDALDAPPLDDEVPVENGGAAAPEAQPAPEPTDQQMTPAQKRAARRKTAAAEQSEAASE